MTNKADLNYYVDLAKHYTANNNHTDALITVAQYAFSVLPDKDIILDIIEVLRAINTLHMFEGSMTGLMSYRETLAANLRNELTPDIREAFKGII